MQREALTSAMRNSISEVLETMFFLPIEFPEIPAPESQRPSGDNGILSTRLAFRGPFSGHLHLIIPEDLAQFLTVSFLGEEEDAVSREQVLETVKEVINMIAGNTFSRFDDQSVFDLEVPEVVPLGGAVEEGPVGEREILVMVDTLDNSLAVQMVLDP